MVFEARVVQGGRAGCEPRAMDVFILLDDSLRSQFQRIVDHCQQANYTAVEGWFRVLIGIDHIYVMEQATLDLQLSQPPFYLQYGLASPPANILIPQTWLKETKTVQEDIYYGFGSLLGGRAIVFAYRPHDTDSPMALLEHFADFATSPAEWQPMLNRKLSNVHFKMQSSGQYKLLGYQFRE